MDYSESLLVHFRRVEKLREEALDYQAIDLSSRQLCDLELLLNRGFFPLGGYLESKDYNNVVEAMRLVDGTVWPMPICLDVDEQTAANHCGGCTRCIDACPTGALKPYELDANKCISNLTIENKSDQIPDEFKGKFDNWIFGCDICQQVCPWNRLSEPHNEPEFNPSEELLKMKKTDWENLSEEKFTEVFKSSPLKRAKFEGIKRNIRFVNDEA